MFGTNPQLAFDLQNLSYVKFNFETDFKVHLHDDENAAFSH